MGFNQHTTARLDELTHARLVAAVHYEVSTGVFTRLQKTGARAIVGSRADKKRAKDTYRTIHILGHELLAHRVAWFYVTEVWPPNNIDHRDGDPANNAFSNLRLATQQQNCFNSRKPKHNKSGLKGVYWNKEKECWSAQIKLGKSTHLGHFKNLEDAHAAYVAAAKKHFGEFARNA